MANNNVPNVQQTTSKFLNNQPVFCPWASKAPLPSIAGSRCSNITTNVPNNPLVLTNRGQKNHLSKMCCQQGQQIRRDIEMQHSSTQFFHFLRLMQLFPDVHPATLHSVMFLCKNDFFAAVDKLLYAKKCKEFLLNRRNYMQDENKYQKYHPYCCQYNKNVNFVNEIVKPKLNHLNQCKNNVNNFNCTTSISNGPTFERDFKMNATENKRCSTRNRFKKEKSESPSTLENNVNTNDLQPVTSPTCNLPIKPLSPISIEK